MKICIGSYASLRLLQWRQHEWINGPPLSLRLSPLGRSQGEHSLALCPRRLRRRPFSGLLHKCYPRSVKAGKPPEFCDSGKWGIKILQTSHMRATLSYLFPRLAACASWAGLKFQLSVNCKSVLGFLIWNLCISPAWCFGQGDTCWCGKGCVEMFTSGGPMLYPQQHINKHFSTTSL